ncbi:MAG: glycosyltransferase family 2 protein [Flavobacteriaceae bacterium]|nr:glycosyltransferase family 2 protein [Flavobacteriaceae bacterium]
MKNLISIIVPCYNQAQYLDECLQSVLEQTYTNWECIIINDGSPDNTEEVAKKWSEKDNRFKYFYKENGGLSSARNAGIKIAQGEWILPFDADDRIGNRYLEFAEKEFDKKNTIIYCKAKFFGNKNGIWNLPDFNFNNFLLGNQIFCSAFFRKELWQKCGGYDENMRDGLEDWEFWIHILSMEKNPKVYKMDYVGFYYRVKKNSMITSLNSNKEKSHRAYNYIYQKHQKVYEHFFDPFQVIAKQRQDIRYRLGKFLLQPLVFLKSIIKRLNI